MSLRKTILTATLAAVLMAPTLTAQAALAWTVTPTKSQPSTLDDIDAKGNETWAVGSNLIDSYQDTRPLAFRWNGTRWVETPQPVRTNATLSAVAVVSAKEVWAVGDDRAKSKPLAMRWNGTAWSVVPGPAVPTGAFSDVTIAPDGTPWISGWADVDGRERAVVYRYAKGAWQPLTAGLENSINGNTLTVLSATNAWLGLNGGMAHFDGKTWKLVDDVPADGSQIPTNLVATGPKDIWASGVAHTSKGERPLVLHYDGKAWSQVATPQIFAQLYDITIHNKQPIAVGEKFTEADNIITEHPYVLTLKNGAFVETTAPAPKVGTLTGVRSAGTRLWTVGAKRTPGADPTALAARVG
ncbi:hypothetical protein E1263_34790 [Kribbella antibiotica]|uniref:Uncharacterized protein n=1 Tax=Kribbella antibiotica TaxID=190195 RepID=A0A4R4YUN0_9ACTN|nr:hypothetical protein [Kribbella antibiotica]TDD47332.1 hypothetical protein E1263_34790 [Kribbella antibiotica]